MVWINEFHYDNAGSDTGEFVEVAGAAGTDLTGWSLTLYNGSFGGSYITIALSGTIPDEGGGFGAVSVSATGIQNGAPDGLALVDDKGAVVEFLSYEGSFTAVDGPAFGLVSTDIGINEAGDTQIGQSLQRTGTGDSADDFSWTGPSAESPGSLNTGQTVFCFAADTRISTPDGPRRVDALRIGDLILTQDLRSIPVKWVGRQVIFKTRTGIRMQPVRIRAGALGNGLPHADLTVTADHGMILDGNIINASALVNHDTIDFVPLAELEETFTVYHVETEHHDIILANGAASETFVDAVTRSHFDNHQEYLHLYGAERLIPEMPQPRITSARLVPDAIKMRLGIGMTTPNTQRCAV